MTAHVIHFPVSINIFFSTRTPGVREFNQWLREHDPHVKAGSLMLWRLPTGRGYELLRLPLKSDGWLERTGKRFATLREAYMGTARILRAAAPGEA